MCLTICKIQIISGPYSQTVGFHGVRKNHMKTWLEGTFITYNCEGLGCPTCFLGPISLDSERCLILSKRVWTHFFVIQNVLFGSYSCGTWQCMWSQQESDVCRGSVKFKASLSCIRLSQTHTHTHNYKELQKILIMCFSIFRYLGSEHREDWENMDNMLMILDWERWDWR